MINKDIVMALCCSDTPFVRSKVKLQYCIDKMNVVI